MKPWIMFLLTVGLSFALVAQPIRLDDDDEDETTETTESKEEKTDDSKEAAEDAAKDKTDDAKKDVSSDESNFAFALDAIFGAVTVSGQNYQQIGLRPQVRIFKFGFGLDMNILIDEDGKVRKEDWDDAFDYVDKIYYISWAKKGAPFYVRIGGLENTYLGYNIMVNGYSNMVEYPTHKRLGMDLSIQLESFGAELFLNDFKETFDRRPAMVSGLRLTYKVLGDLTLGAGIAADLNEYKGLWDTDGDGYPDEVDRYPYDSSIVTDIDRYRALGISETTIDTLIAASLLDPTDKNDLQQVTNITSTLTIYSVDLGYPVIKSSFIDFDIYTQGAHIIETKGFGLTPLGMKFRAGLLTLTAEYKYSSKKFEFGYFNQTYELERAQYVQTGANTVQIVTKKQTLETAQAKNGYYAKLDFNIFNVASLDASYQDLIAADSQHSRTVTASFGIKDDLIPKVAKVRGYYIQNNVENLTTFKTPSTIMGAVVGFKLGAGTLVSFNYQLTFDDKNGDGNVNGSEETIKTIYITMSAQLI